MVEKSLIGIASFQIHLKEYLTFLVQETGLLCHRINAEKLETNIESWINDVPSFFGNIDIPKVAIGKPKKVNQDSKKVTKKIQENIVEQTYMIEVSNHLPSTKDRTSLIFWTPYSWGIEEECLERLEDLVRSENLADSYIFSDGQRILFICPEAFTRAKIVKLLDKIGILFWVFHYLFNNSLIIDPALEKSISSA